MIMTIDKSNIFSPHAPIHALLAVLFLSFAAYEYLTVSSDGDMLSATLTLAMASISISNIFNTGTKRGLYKGWWYLADAPAVSRFFGYIAGAMVVIVFYLMFTR